MDYGSEKTETYQTYSHLCCHHFCKVNSKKDYYITRRPYLQRLQEAISSMQDQLLST